MCTLYYINVHLATNLQLQYDYFIFYFKRDILFNNLLYLMGHL
jgi:hypothetical protein